MRCKYLICNLAFLAFALLITGPAFDCRPHVLSLFQTALAQSAAAERDNNSVPLPTVGNSTTQKHSSASTKDASRIAAERALIEGQQLLKDQTAESTRLAINKLKESLALWRVVSDQQQEARTLRLLGDAHEPLGEYLTAMTFYKQALSISRSLKDGRSEAETLNKIGRTYITLGDSQKALSFCTQALDAIRAYGNEQERAQVLNNLGEVQYDRGELQSSLEFYKQALPLWEKAEDREGQALTLLNFGYTYSDLGDGPKALATYNRALDLWKATDHRRGQALTLTAIGRLYSRMGESQKALDFFERAMKLIHMVGDPIEEARTLSGFANVYDRLGAGERALEHYHRALPLFRSANYKNGEATTLGDAGRAYLLMGDTQKALDYHHQALTIFRALGNWRMEAVERKELGKCYESQGERAKALTQYELARAAYRSQKDLRGEAETLSLIGRIYEGLGRKREAFDYYSKALPLSRQTEYRVVEAATLYYLARLARDDGNLTGARDYMDQVLNVVESLRGKVGSQNLRSSYFASVRQQYEFYIDLLMSLDRERPSDGFAAAAFVASERARARSLLETLAAARVGVRSKADPALLERENSLRRELNDAAERRMQLGRADQDQVPTLTKQIDELTARLSEVEAQIRAGSLEYTASLQTQPLGLKTIQEHITDDNTVLLEYSLGDERSYLWEVSKTEVHSYELAGRAQIETAARSVYELLTANQLVADQTFEQRQERMARARERLPSEIANLSKLVLGPIESRLGKKRLLIIADGALQYIPFQILTKSSMAGSQGSETATNAGQPVPLVVDHEIINEASASALVLLLSETTTRKPTSKTVAVLADPVFENDDPRLPAPSKTILRPEKGEGTELHRALRDFTWEGGIPRLPASADEADAIISVAPWWSTLKAVGFEASRVTAMNPEIGEYRFVHFATHGFLNAEYPELSGVVLSMFDAQGQPQQGFLRLHDIYNLKLPVDLVVLSACNTGLGKDVKGEGLIGLTRGFMHAGAASVVASLWKVDDEATAELMRYFYQFMFTDGLAPAAALRQAQLKMLQQKRWESPYYWSGFIIQGRYTSYDKTNYFSRRWSALWVGVAAVFSISVFFVLKRRRKRLV